MDLLGAILSTGGVGLAIWSVWHSRQHAKRLSTIQRNEIVSLWAFLDRVRTSVYQIEQRGYTKDIDDFSLLEGKMSALVPRLHKGLCDLYVMLAAHIVQKTPGVSLDDVERWVKMNRLKTGWQKDQFVNLVEASESMMSRVDTRVDSGVRSTVADDKP